MATQYAATAVTGRPDLATTTVTGGGGVCPRQEAGNPRGRPIVFLHGFSQCWLAWSRQMLSDLANDYRLVAMDLRATVFQTSPQTRRATRTRECGRMTCAR